MTPTLPTSVLTVPTFFASALVYILRVVTLTSFAGLLFLHFVPPFHIVYAAPTYSVVFVHRLFTMRSITALLSQRTLLICLAEFAALTFHHYKTIWTDRWSSQITIAFATVSWVLMIIVGIEFIVRFLVFALNIPTLWRYPLSHTIPDRLIRMFPDLHSISVGRSIWKGHFVGETNFMRCARGILASITFFALTGFVLIKIILGPARETGLVTVKETRSLDLPRDFSFDSTVWNVVLTRVSMYDDPSTDWNSIFHSAVQVIPLWDNSSSLAPPCVHLPGSSTLNDTWSIFQAITIHCPSRVLNKTESRLDALSLPYQDGQPDLLVIVNYTTLGVDPSSIIDMRRASVEVRVGLNNDTDKVIQRTVPFTLLPGVNLVAGLIFDLRQLFKRPAISSFGFFDSVSTFFVARIAQSYPDPQAGLSSVPRSREISTLRTFAMADSSERIFIQDNRENSLVRGISDIGGLWTSLSGIFAVVFGISLMRVLFGVKPISVFGLVHLLEKGRIIEACLEEYPRIKAEMALPKHERGLAALLRDHLLDINLFPSEHEGESDLESTGSETYSFPVSRA